MNEIQDRAIAEQIRAIELNHARSIETNRALQEYLDAAYPGQGRALPAACFDPHPISGGIPLSSPLHPANLTTPPPAEMAPDEIESSGELQARLRGERPARMWNQERLDQQRDCFRALAERIRAGQNQPSE